MSHVTTRRLFAVVVALLVVCSVAGGPAVAAAAATGTFGEEVGGTIDADDGSSDASDGDSAAEDSSAGGSDDGDSSDDAGNDDESTGGGPFDGSSADGDSADGGDDGGNADAATKDDGSEDSIDGTEDANGDGHAGNATGAVEGTVRGTGDAVEDAADGVPGPVGTTADVATDTDYDLVGTVSGTTGLGGTLALPTTGLHETARVEATDGVAGRAVDPHGAAAGGDTGSGGDHTAAELAGAVDPDAATPDAASGDGDLPGPAGLSGGATLGLGALAAVAVARSAPLFATSSAGGSGSATTGYLSALFEKVRPFLVPLRYSRYDDSDPLEHEARELVYEIVNDAPGSYLSEVSERAGLPLSTTRHHVKVLEREELVSGAKLRGKRRFYPAYAEGIELAAALNDEATAGIIDALARLGAASVSDLAEDLGRDPSTISHHLQRLEADDIVTRERDGRAVVNRLTGEARDAMAPGTTPRPGEPAEALAD